MSNTFGEVTITFNAGWEEKLLQKPQRALRNMGQAIISTATVVTPKKEGPLRKSAHLTGMKNEINVVFGNVSTKYAMPQEQGWIRRNGKIIYFKHYTTPNTGPHYLRNSGVKIAKKGLKVYS